MKPLIKYLFVFILLLSLYHLIRDILQTLDIHNAFTNILHRPLHLWCGAYCDYVTYPLDVIGIVGSFVVLKRNGVGVLGKIVLFSQPLWLLALILP